MDVEQRALLTVQYRDSRAETAVVGGNGKKKLPSMEFALWALKEMLTEEMNEDSVMNNCTKYFILSDVGYTNSAFDGVLDVGLNRISAIDRGRDVVRASRKWMQVWADIEELTK